MRVELIENGWSFYLNKGAAIIIEVPKHGEEKELIVPSTLQGYPVEEIEFYMANIRTYGYTSIRLPHTLKRFDATCFPELIESIYVDPESKHFLSKDGILYSKDGKTLVCFPSAKQDFNPSCLDNVEIIADGAFSCCDCLTELTLPESVTEIGDFAFTNCERLRSIHIPDSVKHIGKAVFAYNALKSTRLSSNIKSLEASYDFDGEGEGFFQGSAIEEITLPEGIEKIGYSTFCQCRKLREVHIPASVKIIEDCAFYECCSLEKITVCEDNEHYYSKDGVLYSRNGELILYPQNKQDTSYNVPEEVRVICPHAFFQSRNLKELILSDNIENLGYRTFACSDIEKINIPRKVTSLGLDVFLNCCVKELYIPKEVTYIEMNSNTNGNINPYKDKKILVDKNSYAERMCIEHHLNYSVVNN